MVEVLWENCIDFPEEEEILKEEGNFFYLNFNRGVFRKMPEGPPPFNPPPFDDPLFNYPPFQFPESMEDYKFQFFNK